MNANTTTTALTFQPLAWDQVAAVVPTADGLAVVDTHWGETTAQEDGKDLGDSQIAVFRTDGYGWMALTQGDQVLNLCQVPGDTEEQLDATWEVLKELAMVMLTVDDRNTD